MPRVLKVFGFSLSAFALWACGQSALTPARPALRGDEVETRVTPPRPQREMPRLLAPPPAYGNKIVMASERTLPLNN
ncbi:MAG: hypothetical protein ABJB12_00385 [Pseudomonadota bacterium]